MHWVDVRKNKKIHLRKNQALELTLNILENSDVEIILNKNSELKLQVRQEKKANVNMKLSLGENSRVYFFSLSKTAKKGRTLIELNGRKASFRGTDISFSGHDVIHDTTRDTTRDSIRDTTYDMTYDIIHRQKQTFSSLDLRGVVMRGKVNVKGNVLVTENAPGSDAFISGKYIALQDAEAIFCPNLEILNKNVRASHSAAVVKIDEEQFFYLCSRGMPAKKAQKMLIESFVKIPEEFR